MSLHLYDLDRRAHKLVLDARNSEEVVDKKSEAPKVLNEAHKMRVTAAYGLERFWGEHLRLKGEADSQKKESQKQSLQKKSDFWKATWNELASILELISHIKLPDSEASQASSVSSPKNLNPPRKKNSISSNEDIVEQIWKKKLSNEDRKLAQAILVQLCDSIVWWTQRYKKVADRDN
jgi:hypothetical protein